LPVVSVIMSCCKLALIWTTVLSPMFLGITAFTLIPSRHVQLHRSSFAAASSGFPTDSSENDTPLALTLTTSQRIRTEEMLDDALVSNCTAAQLLLDEISDLRSGKKEEELDLLFGHLLFLADRVVKDEDYDDHSGVNGFPWWARIRLLSRFSRRARRASLHRTLKFSEEKSETNDASFKSRQRRSALVLVLRSLATPYNVDDGLVHEKEEDASSPSKIKQRRSRTAIRNIERTARQEMKKNSNHRDMSSRIPPGLETPKFTVIGKRKEYEVRTYDPFSICSVPMAKPRPNKSLTDQPISNPQLSGASSFGALAGYLFGKNDKSTSMKMTTPVLVVGEGEDKEMSFILPSTYWDEEGLDNAPKPLEDSLVSIKRDTGGNRAVLSFGGFAPKDTVRTKSADLLKGLEYDKEWAAVEDASVTLAQYNDPFTPPWKRINEVSVPVITKNIN